MKNIFYVFIIMIFYILISTVIKNNNILPDDSIRIRVIANSNSKKDQSIKYEVTSNVINNLYPKLESLKSKEDIKNTILSNMDNIDESVNKILTKYNEVYKINYGMNYFPKKVYKGITYDEGYYESLVITIGNGEGDNYWCVLYPTLCMVEIEESDDIIYTTLISEIMSSN